MLGRQEPAPSSDPLPITGNGRTADWGIYSQSVVVVAYAPGPVGGPAVERPALVRLRFSAVGRGIT